MYQLSPHIHEKVRKSVLITGSARGGTSIFGKLLASLETVEYFFEPPTINSLFTVIDEMPDELARFLFDTYVFEDLLVGALSGRAINLRAQDDSSVRHTKTSKEIALRMEGAARKRELDTSAAKIVIKMPSFVHRLPEIYEILQINQLIVLIREPESAINSLLRRGWFSNALLQAGDIIWPNRYDGALPAPHWVPRTMLEEWENMSEPDRAALYYITQTNLSESVNATVFDYEQIIARPRALLAVVADQMGLEFGPCSKTLLNEVTVQKTTSKFDLGLLRDEFRSLVIETYERTRERRVRV
ncbi:MAG: hypothetical protein ABGX47_12230 [Martelella sp.]|uniref:hypothetical protein n=1 Tax=Martelella sp. TaxID=1969699 RepID=UPI0032420B78